MLVARTPNATRSAPCGRDDPEGRTNQGEAKQVRWRGAAKLGRETSSPAFAGLDKNPPEESPNRAECTPVMGFLNCAPINNDNGQALNGQ